MAHVFRDIISNIQRAEESFSPVLREGCKSFSPISFSGDENSDCLQIHDGIWNFVLSNPDVMDSDWFLSRMLFSPSAQNFFFNPNAIASFFINHLPKPLYMGLRFFVCTTSDAGDLSFLASHGIEEQFFSPSGFSSSVACNVCSLLPDKGIVVYNVDFVLRQVRALYAEMELSVQDVAFEFYCSFIYGLHLLGQFNRFLPLRLLSWKPDPCLARGAFSVRQRCHLADAYCFEFLDGFDDLPLFSDCSVELVSDKSASFLHSFQYVDGKPFDTPHA